MLKLLSAAAACLAQSVSLPLTAVNLCNRASVAMLTSLWCTRVLSIVEIGADHCFYISVSAVLSSIHNF
ncbi:hypothetical protein ACLBSJ_33870, partial [Klebsiella pneumoniae]|uniref:hypothetical protein n=1 Tax=Klebsiella pneumoniae TaxID=573 RepID=UPI003968B9F0